MLLFMFQAKVCCFLCRLLISLLLTKEEERLGSLVVLVLGRLCSLWNSLTMSPKLMVCILRGFLRYLESDAPNLVN